MASKNFVRVVAASMALTVMITGGQDLLAQKSERGRLDTRRFYPDDPLWQDDDRRDIAPVQKIDLSATYDVVENSFGKPSRSRGPALNTNTLGEVPDSSWFTNRLGLRDMTIDEVLHGAETIEGPAPGPWTVIGRPGSGITPKFTIKDANGVVFVVKLDPPEAPELASSVELIGTKIFHAIGYNVPEDFIASLDPAMLTIAPGTMFKAKDGVKRPLLMADVQRWLTRQPRQDDGTIRVLASRWVPGRVVGQFKYIGTRADDPNDIYPHERRRELRALKVFAAWLNHDDARALNTIDAYVEDNGRRYIKHYLQDFGSILGSSSTAAQSARAGNEYYIEGKQIAKGVATLGLWQREWSKVSFPDLPAVGHIEADYFEPWRWKTEYPHPAFEQMDAADAFWAASIAARFSDRMIKSIVEVARLSDPQSAKYLADVIIRRRDKVVAYWLTGTNPLDRFEARRHAGEVTVTFDHAAMRNGLANDTAKYIVNFASLDNMTGAERMDGVAVATSQRVFSVPGSAWGKADAAGFRYAIASIRTLQDGYPHWVRPVRVTLRERGGAVEVIAIDRPVQDAAATRGTN
jgi:hypothetical protein